LIAAMVLAAAATDKTVRDLSDIRAISRHGRMSPSLAALVQECA
jgi:hypothetical protein